LREYNLNSDEVVYFEHNLEAVESAKSVWINTFHYDKDKKDLVSLERFLRENIEISVNDLWKESQNRLENIEKLNFVNY
jgi:hypothetical protein